MKKTPEARVVVAPEIKTGEAVKNKEIPFRLLVMARFSGKEKPAIKTPRVVTTTGDTSLDRLMSDMQPTVTAHVGNKLGGTPTQDGEAPTMPLTLSFCRMEDFSAAGLERSLAESVPAFREKLAILRKLTNFQAKLMNSKDLEGIDEALDNHELREALADLANHEKGAE